MMNTSFALISLRYMSIFNTLLSLLETLLLFASACLLHFSYLTNSPLQNNVAKILGRWSFIWIFMQTLVDEAVNLSRTLLWTSAVPQPPTCWLLMSHNFPQDHTIAEDVSLTTSHTQCLCTTCGPSKNDNKKNVGLLEVELGINC